MKVSVNWLKQFTDIDISVDELVEKIGIQLGAVEEVVDLGKKYQGIIIARVVNCDKHPNADKLSVCWIDDGGKTEGVERNEQGLVQVVCGAPNVREGLMVAWLPPGSTVPSTVDKDPFVLGSRELRGVVSNGMLASAHELAISDDHNGIVELDIAAEPGSDFAETYQLNDHVIDIENKMFTHRPDCFGLLGVAREVAGIQHKSFSSPDWYKQALDRIKPGKTKLDLKVQNNAQDLVPRFMAVAMADVTVKASPFMLQTELSRVGLRPINNIVDITNYLMYLTGQPIHAYDADKLRQYGDLSLETRLSRKGDTINLLNGKTVELQDESTVLITCNDVPVGIGGCMGGADTEVDETTKNIVIECANFDMYAIRRTSMKYGLFTDAVTRFNKGQSPLQNDVVLEEAVAMVQSLADAHVATDVADIHGGLPERPVVRTNTTFINMRLGLQLSPDEVATLLRNVEFTVNISDDELHIVSPFWRTDIEIAEDIVEEVGRLYGYDRLPLVLPRREITATSKNNELELKRTIRDRLSGCGANEVLTYGFVHGELLEKVGQDPEKAFKLSNALSPDLQYYRLSLTPSLIEKVHPNIKAGFGEFALFELGKSHSKTEIAEDGLPKEFGRVALVIAKQTKKQTSEQPAYYQAKYYLETLLGSQPELTYVRLDEADTLNHEIFEQMLAPFEPKRSAVIYRDGAPLGVVGEYKQSVSRALKLPAYCAGFEVFLNPLQKIIGTEEAYTQLSRFPSSTQDLTLRVTTDVAYQNIYKLVLDACMRPNLLCSVTPVSIYQKSDDTSHQQVTFSLTVGSYEKTLKTEEVNALLEEITDRAHEAFGATRV